MSGLFTPTEAGAAGTVAVIIVSMFYKRFSLKMIGHSLLEAAQISAMILLLIFGAQYFSHFLTTSEIAPAISNALVEAELSKYIVLLLVILLYFILGMLMDIWSVMIITLPIFFPILTDMGFDPLQLGVIAILCIMVGCITPPVGVVVFSLAGHAQRSAHVHHLQRMLAVRMDDADLPGDTRIPALAVDVAAGPDVRMM